MYATAVLVWMDTAMDQLATAGFVQIDLDDLLVEPPLDAVHVSLKCVHDARVRALSAGVTVHGAVVVPLAPSRSMTGPAPTLQRLLNKPWSFGPGRTVPAIYLLKPSVWSVYEAVEEYRRDLATKGLPPDIVAYLRSWKPAARGEKFDRAV
ncbi:hypothetical protein [Terrabacter terrigena]|uniref:Uncharacterized protein n=1 Tax=Terrabacter terrigena TaxID=574718 RepID=A0ABW3MZZ4_9MICO